MNKTRQNSAYSLYYHIILTVKYRKPLLVEYEAEVKATIKGISNKWKVERMEADRNHLYILVNATPAISPSQIIKSIKQKTTYQMWQLHASELKREFWKEHTFWSRSYFINSIGSASKEAIDSYIMNQKSHSSPTLKRWRASDLKTKFI